MSPAAIAIRRATPADKRAVGEMCSSDDYVPDVFDDWVGDRRGGLWIATIGERAVGVAKLTLVGQREAWLHALRVHPRYRRRGAARALLAHRLDRAKRLGARVARLDTANDNVAVHRLMREFGFRRATTVTYWLAAAGAGSPPRRAGSRELAALLRVVRQGDGLLHDRFARRAATRDDLATAIRRGLCVVSGPPGRPAALAVIDAIGASRRSGGPMGPRLRVRLVGGAPRGLRRLLEELPAEARRRGLPRLGLNASTRHWPRLRAAGYERPWSGAMLVFEKRL